MIKKMYRSILLVQIFTISVNASMPLINTILTGKFLSAESLAACGIASPVLYIFVIASRTVVTGIEHMCSVYIGEGKSKKASQVFTSTFIFSFLLLLIIAIIFIVFLDPICSFLDSKTDTYLYFELTNYIWGVIFSLPFSCIIPLLLYTLQIEEEKNACFAITLTCIFTNVVFDVINIFILKWELLGMGIASSISLILSCVVAFFIYYKKNCSIKFDFTHLSFYEFSRVLLHGIPSTFCNLFFSIYNMSVNYILLNYVGEGAVAAWSAISTTSAYIFCIGNGLAYTTNIVTSILYGAGDKNELKKVNKTFINFSIWLNLIVMIIIIIGAEFLAMLFVNEKNDTFYYIVSGLRLYSICLIVNTIVLCYVNYYIGQHKVLLSNLIAVFVNVIQIIYLFVITPVFGWYGLMLCFTVCNLITLILIMILFSAIKKQNPFNLQTYLILPDTNPNLYVYDIDIHNKEISDKNINLLMKFLEDKNINTTDLEKIKFLIFVVTNNIWKKIPEEHNNLIFNIKAFIVNEKLSLRFIYNLKKFDVSKYVSEKQNLSTSIQFSKNWLLQNNMNYQYIIGFNVFNVSFK